MSEHKPKKNVSPKPPRAFGWVAEYVDEHSLLEAARKVRDSGYTKTDAFTPFPVHGIDEALGIKPTVLPFIVLTAGFTGLCTALLMQWWMNGVDYKYIISGKPFGITPASIPVSFELTILFSAFTSVLGMLALNGLPKFSNPIFNNPKIDRATDDRFFLYVDAKDKYYNRDSVKDLLSATHPESLDEVIEDASPAALPRPILLTALLLVLTGLIPAMIVLNMRAGFSDLPRWHVFFDMDFQPKKKSQQTTTVFADGRTMRPRVDGTVPRGSLTEHDSFYLGYDPAKVSALTGSSVKYVGAQDPQPPETAESKPADAPAPAEPPASDAPQPETPKSDAPAAEAPATEQPKAEETKPTEPAKQDAAPVAAPTPPGSAANSTTAAPAAGDAPKLPWIEKLPIEADEANIKLGKQKFETYCVACHGYSGYGDGLVQRRAAALMQDTWAQPTSLHADRVFKQPVGQIFHTITNGQGKMAPYGSSLSPKERWAIVLYVKALQRSRNASIDDVPVDQRSKLTESK